MQRHAIKAYLGFWSESIADEGIVNSGVFDGPDADGGEDNFGLADELAEQAGSAGVVDHGQDVQSVVAYFGQSFQSIDGLEAIVACAQNQTDGIGRDGNKE